VLATPESGGFDLAAWIIPAAGILLAALAVLVGLRRWRRRPAGPAPPREPDSADSERLRSDLARYDL
jgi:hypothetical protein